jgi:glycosyltransferase involved in cell wall biosynthesis
MFVVQVALVKGRGGIATAIAHYERMFREVGVRSALVFRGPSADTLRAEGADIIEPPRLLSSPLATGLPVLGDLGAQIRARAKGAPIVALVHSDLALGAIRRLLPDAVTITPCHTDKTKHKRAADLVLTLNGAQQVLVQAALPDRRVKEFGNPFVPPAGARGPSDAAAPNGRLRVNFLGRFEAFKDPLTLVRAFIAARLPENAELRVIGAGPLDAELRQAAAASARAISFVGWLDQPFSQFDKGDLLVLPSNWESYSYVAREALHHHVPVIASDISVHRDALGDGAFGRLYRVGDAEALARSLEQAGADLEALRVLSARGGAALAARYGAAPFWAALSAEIADIRASRT